MEALDESAVKKAMEAAWKEEKKAKNAARAAGRALKDAEDADKVVNIYDLKIIHEIAAGVDFRKDMLIVAVLGGGGVEGNVQTFGTFKKNLDALGAKLS